MYGRGMAAAGRPEGGSPFGLNSNTGRLPFVFSQRGGGGGALPMARSLSIRGCIWALAATPAATAAP